MIRPYEAQSRLVVWQCWRQIDDPALRGTIGIGGLAVLMPDP